MSGESFRKILNSRLGGHRLSRRMFVACTNSNTKQCSETPAIVAVIAASVLKC